MSYVPPAMPSGEYDLQDIEQYFENVIRTRNDARGSIRSETSLLLDKVRDDVREGRIRLVPRIGEIERAVVEVVYKDSYSFGQILLDQSGAAVEFRPYLSVLWPYEQGLDLLNPFNWFY